MADTFTVDSHGITCEVEKARLLDERFAYCLIKLGDGLLGEKEKLIWYARMIDILFGESNAYEIMCKLANANGGTISQEEYNEFFNDILKQADEAVKNSSRSQESSETIPASSEQTFSVITD